MQSRRALGSMISVLLGFKPGATPGQSFSYVIIKDTKFVQWAKELSVVGKRHPRYLVGIGLVGVAHMVEATHLLPHHRHDVKFVS